MAKAKPTPRYNLALLVEAVADNGGLNERPTGRLEARAVAIDTHERAHDDSPAGNVEGVSFVYDDDCRWIRDFDSFRFHSWFYRDDLRPYGNRPQFDAGSYVDLDDAERFHRVLKAIDKALAKLNSARGYIVDLADHLGRVAEAIGAESIIFRNDLARESRSGYKYRVLPIGDGINSVRSRLEELRIKAEEVTAS